MDDPQNELKAVQIAGTKGKGSVANILANILHQSSYKTGLYTRWHPLAYSCMEDQATTEINLTNSVQKLWSPWNDMNLGRCSIFSSSKTSLLSFSDNKKYLSVFVWGENWLIEKSIYRRNFCSAKERGLLLICFAFWYGSIYLQALYWYCTWCLQPSY